MKNIKTKRSKFLYSVFKLASNVYASTVFKRKFIRNEIKDKKGPFVIISNHAAALDFVNLVGACKKLMNFVISNSFYKTIPVQGVMPRLGLIPKQQFQTNLADMRRMKNVIDEGGILVIYPSGLMADAGTPTPIPIATYRFLQWLGADVYMAKNIGTYFAMPKWRKGGARTGRTYIDIYKLFDKEELASKDTSEIEKIASDALYFDAYEEQEEHLIKYKNNNNIEGLENILYVCPHCKKEFTIKTKDKNVIYCEACGFEQYADEYQFLHKTSEIGEEIRHPSKWNELVLSCLKGKIDQGETELSAEVEIQMIANGKSRFEPVGSGTLSLCTEKFNILGSIHGEDVDISIPIASFAALPYKPGVFIEIQHNDSIYRCFPKDGRTVVKFINMVKLFYALNNSVSVR